MTNIEKFRSDARRIARRFRAEHGGLLDADAVCAEIAALFAGASGIQGALPHLMADYWKGAYVDASENLSDEPSAQNIEVLCAILSFLDGSGECEECLDCGDWHELAQIVSGEAEDLPIDILQRLMGTIVSKGAL